MSAFSGKQFRGAGRQRRKLRKLQAEARANGIKPGNENYPVKVEGR